MSTTRFAVPKAPATEAPLAHAALVLCAHGQGGTSGITNAHAAAIRRSGIFARVEGCCITGEPDLATTLGGIAQSEIFVVPLLMADGYTCRSVLPPLLSDYAHAGARLHLCPPLGVAPGLAAIAADRAADLCCARGWPCNGSTLIIAAHGTPRSPASGASAQRLAKAINRRKRFARVCTGFLEQAPMLAEVLRAMRGTPCIVAGFFMDNGTHAAKDIPEIIAASHPEAAYTGAIGCSNRIADLIVDLVRAEARKTS